MITIQPKAHFHKVFDSGSIADLGNTVNLPFVRTAIVFSMAEMQHQCCTAEQMRGAQIFQNILLNLANPDEPGKNLPVKNLKEIPTTPSK